ncbi:MAG: 2-oxo acid dehydrogenase subunit E2 [Propionibacteriaceae bacterium]|jgi:pyruvate/2-oxoglutarate dehydrogenase complex dihydrolipoamide acyltransferase (E2) component|nr:2-oxo acid dehydrogenase subunit E2 [Propionibacteriaceae bacterium]
MGRGDRYDATRVTLPSSLNGLFPYIMRGRNNSIAYFPVTVEVDALLEYIDQSKGTDHEITFFQACLTALTKILRARPQLNRYIQGRRLYQRKDVVLSFIARRAMEEDSTETNVLVAVKSDDTAETLKAKLTGEIRLAKDGVETEDDKLVSLFYSMPRLLLRIAIKLIETWDFYFDTPKFLRGVDPLRCSVYIANLGSVGMGAPYHHLIEWGTCSIFMCIGQVRKAVIVGEGDVPVVRQVVDLTFALDERIADGYYDARALELFKKYFAEPALLQTI